MIVTLQKLSNLLFLLYIICPFSLLAQQSSCNTETFLDSDKRKIPKGVCIPKGYVIRYLYSKYNPIDFNRDGLTDFAFSATKRTSTIGDTSFLAFYKMNIDSSFSLSKLYNNVFPIYFDPSNEDPVIKNPELEKLFNCYQIPRPFDHLDINNDTIEIVVTMDGHGYQYKIYHYKYEPKHNDWKLIKKTISTNGKGQFLPTNGKDLWLSNFSYCEEE